MTESASFDINAVQTSAMNYKYTITLDDTGTTPLGTFWFSWVPGAGYLPNLPLFSAPAGWTGRITDGAPPADGYSIQWVANSPSSALQAGHSLAFTFTSATAPSVLLGASTIHPSTPVDTSFLYSGTPFSDAGISVTADRTVAHLLGGVTDVYAGDVLTRKTTVDADGATDIAVFDVQGKPYSSRQTHWSPSGVLLANSFDLNDGSGKLNLIGSDLTANASTGAIDLGSAADFAFTPHASELYNFLAGATDDTVTFADGFGAAKIKGFASASTSDVLDVSSLFSTFQDAKNAMTSFDGNTIITDSSHDKLTLVGVSASTLTAARLGF